MIGYLIKRIFVLALFLGAIMIMPFAVHIGIVIYIIGIGIYNIGQGFSDARATYKEAALYIIGGIGAFYLASEVGKAITEDPVFYRLFVYGILSITVIVAGFFTRRFIAEEDANYSSDGRVDLLTRFYPYLLIIAGFLRLIYEVVTIYFESYVASFIGVIDALVPIGNFLFSICILMYAVRTVYLFIKNK